MTTWQKIFSAVILFAVWGGFVVYGKAPASDYVTAIRDALVALGVFHITLTNPSK